MIILIDPGTHIHQVPVSEDRNSKKCRIIVFSSPKVSSYRTFIKYCKLTLFMPLWNLEEIEHCRFQRPRFLCLLLLRRARALLTHTWTQSHYNSTNMGAGEQHLGGPRSTKPCSERAETTKNSLSVSGILSRPCV